MKVHVIRGENLTSLGSRFEIDFDRAPLRDCGLFAITGPVGAGKSTLLDALCLALFDRTPRLAERGGALIGDRSDESRLGANDVRGVLRRGTGSGFAEVEFRGRSGRRLRARWSVRRARSRAAGKFQPQSMSLTDCLDGRELGGKKTETLAAIEQELGLTFEQFRRSVVLVQNEFAAFLQARSSDRAGLLEHMTDTAIYGELSIRAHLRAADLRTEIRSFERQRDEIEVLDAEARVVLDVACEEVESELAKFRIAAAANATREQLLESIETCNRRVDDFERAVRDGVESERVATALVKKVRGEIVEHDAHATSLQPRIRTARLADQRILDAAAEVTKRERALQTAETALAGAKLVVQSRKPATELPPGFDEVARELGQLLTLGEDLREAQSRLDNAEQGCERASVALREAESAEAAALESVQAAEAQIASAPSADRLTECAAARAALHGDLEAIAELQAARLRMAREQELTAEIEATCEFAAEARRESERCTGEAERGQRDLEAVRAELGIAEFREHVVDGEPCPLCGSLDHPGRPAGDGSPADTARRDALVAEVADLRSRASAATERARISEQTATASSARLEAMLSEAGAGGETCSESAALDAARRHAGEDSRSGEVGDLLGIAAKVRAALTTATKQEVAVVAQFRAAEAARAEFERRRSVWSAARDDVREGKSDVKQRALRVNTAALDRDKSQAGEGAAHAHLTELLDTRTQRLGADRAELAGLRAELEAMRASRRELLEGQAADLVEEGLRVARVELERRLEVARDDQAECGRQFAIAKTELAGAAARRTELSSELGVADAAVEAAFGQLDVAEPGDPATNLTPDERRQRMANSLSRRVPAAEHVVAEHRSRRAADDRGKQQRVELQERIDLASASGRSRLALGDLIGSADGRKFRAFAQGLSFEHLLAHANRHLVEFTPRYRLVRVPGQDLDLQIVDHEMGDEIRGVNSLSGGETFIVSLALALGLASMAAGTAAFETLFIDEGLGTLDPASLETVLATLDALQSTGYQVGVISHVEGLAERVAARIEVRPTGVAGRSEVRVVGVEGESSVSVAT